MTTSEAVRSPDQHPSQADHEVYSFTFFPNVTTLDQATALQLQSGEAAWTNFALVPGHGETVSGLIASKPKAVAFSLALHSEEYDINSDLPVTYDSHTGKFVIDGRTRCQYQLAGAWFSDGVDHHGSMALAVSEASIPEIHLQEDMDTKVEGVVSLGQSPSKELPSAISLERWAGTGGKRYSTEIKKDGTFSFHSVPSGDYFLTVGGISGTYVRTVSKQGTQLPMQRIVLSGESPVVSLDVELSAHAASISGTVERRDS